MSGSRWSVARQAQYESSICSSFRYQLLESYCTICEWTCISSKGMVNPLLSALITLSLIVQYLKNSFVGSSDCLICCHWSVVMTLVKSLKSIVWISSTSIPTFASIPIAHMTQLPECVMLKSILPLRHGLPNSLYWMSWKISFEPSIFLNPSIINILPNRCACRSCHRRYLPFFTCWSSGILFIKSSHISLGSSLSNLV